MAAEIAPPVRRRGDVAGIVSRGTAFTIDLFGLSVFWSTGVYVIQAIGAAFDVTIEMENVVQFVGVSITVLIVLTTYHTAFTALFGRTPGKILMGLRVVCLDGHPLNTWRSLVRTVAYALSAILFLGFLWIAIDDRRQGWHDKVARTVVVYDWEQRGRRR
jgi:uncharacterized RDD family membrane protein YckC